MHELQSFEYATVRVVPQVEREEFLNVGVILYCATAKFLRMRSSLSEAKTNSFCPKLDVEDVKLHLQAFEEICNGTAPASPIAQRDIASRFRWLTATRSTVVQTSRVHPGLCLDPEEKLNALFSKLVL